MHVINLPPPRAACSIRLFGYYSASFRDTLICRISARRKHQMRLVRTLLDRDQDHAEQALQQGLLELYDGDLHFPAGPVERPYVLANFVSTLDGAASYKVPGQSSGSAISGSDPADRFIMGLLRASVDAVMVGAHTIQDASPEGLWIPAETYPDATSLYRDYRLNVLHKPEYPLVVIVSGSGRLDLRRAVFQTSDVCTLIVTTAAGEEELTRLGVQNLPSVKIRVLTEVGIIGPAAILQLLSSQFGIRRLLHEGGPTLFGAFLAAGVVDEFFMTLSPQIAGRLPQTIRPGLVEAVEFVPDTAPWFQLLSVKQKAEYLYLRYRCTGPRRA